MFNRSKFIAFFVFSCIGYNLGLAQAVNSISIGECYEWAHDNYPLIRQLDLIEKSREYNLTSASRASLPRVALNGQASYQSDVTQIPISIPNLDIPEISRDQYKLYLDLYLPITNGSDIRSAKKKILINSEVEKQEIEIELYKIKERINQLYFGVLLMDGQTSQLEIVLSDLSNAYSKTQASVSNGIAIASNLNLILAERIGVEQKIVEQQVMRSAFVEMLATLTNKDFTETTLLERPPGLSEDKEITRPELRLFDLRSESIDIDFARIIKEDMPNVGLFFQGGYGRPALNFLGNSFDTYFLGGVKLNWNLSRLYTLREEKEVLTLAKEKVKNSRATFLLGSDLLYRQQLGEVRKFVALIASDQRLIDLRKSIKETAELQLSNGLITALDFIDYINAEGRARQDKVLHEVQLLRTRYDLTFIAGDKSTL